MIELTREERLAIASLQRLAKRWPKSLWLFATGVLHVMRCGPDGEHVHRGEGIDADYEVATVAIDNDGGDR